jgi:hypothetical protein
MVILSSFDLWKTEDTGKEESFRHKLKPFQKELGEIKAQDSKKSWMCFPLSHQTLLGDVRVPSYVDCCVWRCLGILVRQGLVEQYSGCDFCSKTHERTCSGL